MAADVAHRKATTAIRRETMAAAGVAMVERLHNSHAMRKAIGNPIRCAAVAIRPRAPARRVSLIRCAPMSI